MTGFRRLSTCAVGIGLGWAIASGTFVMPPVACSKEIVFVARDVEDQQAVWLPREIVLHRSTDFLEPLIFQFDNPTARTHVFEAPGLFESIEEDGVQISRPVRITIAPDESEQIAVDRSRIPSNALTGEGATVRFPFFCPLHRADDDLGGTIVVRP